MKTVITYGTFDMLHVGHVRLLKKAKKMGDKLIVALSTDDFNLKSKNKITAIPYKDRKEILESLSFVDLVIPETCWEQKVNDIKNYNVDVFVMGGDWVNKFDHLKDLCEVQYLKRTENISSTEIKKHILSKNKCQIAAM
ncbi:glycerol-3-phosphate cytidylyltransferase [Aeromonas veronii]|uniref:glycerol-3-phosphate cytidylyltransferase n=1 Tax=Aeromonas veronii TaxID=654 RepID=UPI003B9E0893